MTDKCKRRMNRREGYITTEISQRRGARRKVGGSWRTGRGWRIPILGQVVHSPWDVGLPDSVCFSSPKQAVASSEPNFWTHSLQIHCNGLGMKSVTLHIYIYIYIYVCMYVCMYVQASNIRN